MVPDYLLKLSGVQPLSYITATQTKLENIMIDVNTIVKYATLGFMVIMTIAVAAI